MKKRIFFVLFMLAFYFSIINQVPSLLPHSFDNPLVNNTKENLRGGMIGVEVGVSDAVSVSVIRNRWYGKIYENGETSTLLLFKFLKMPLKYYWFNFAYLHGAFLLSMVMVLKGGFKNKMTKVKWWELPLVFVGSLLIFALFQIWGIVLGFTFLYWLTRKNSTSSIKDKEK